MITHKYYVSQQKPCNKLIGGGMIAVLANGKRTMGNGQWFGTEIDTHVSDAA